MMHLKILSHFWAQLSEARQAMLLLDYDGTLAPFRVERDQAVPYPGIRELLCKIQMETATRLVIISGRSVADLLPLLGMTQPPEIWGCHGWEHLPAGETRPFIDLPNAAAKALSDADQWSVAQNLERFVERKPASLAFHWRGMPETEVAILRDKLSSGLQPLADRSGLVIHPFDGGMELRCPGKDKGSAIRALLAETGVGVPIAFLGDDLTDEDGFLALKNHGLSVLVNKVNRSTAADVWIVPPEELLAFLQTWLVSAPQRSSGDTQEKQR